MPELDLVFNALNDIDARNSKVGDRQKPAYALTECRVAYYFLFPPQQP